MATSSLHCNALAALPGFLISAEKQDQCCRVLEIAAFMEVSRLGEKKKKGLTKVQPRATWLTLQDLPNSSCFFVISAAKGPRTHSTPLATLHRHSHLYWPYVTVYSPETKMIPQTRTLAKQYNRPSIYYVCLSFCLFICLLKQPKNQHTDHDA